MSSLIYATPLAFGTPITTTIASAGELDQYTFSSTAGDTFVARIQSSWQNMPVLRLYAPNGTLVSSCANYWQCELTTTAPATGTYLLTVYDEGGDNTGSYTLNLFIPGYPVADFTITPASGIAPLTVLFKDTSTGPPTAWNWNFGDGSSWVNRTDPAQRNVTHSYTRAGTFNATLIVVNALGKASKTQTITVTQGAPVADFTASVTSGFAPLTVQFYDRSTGSPTVWNWSFGDNNSSSVKNPVNTYTTAGNFTVSLTVSNSNSTNQTVRANYIKTTNLSYAYGLVLNNTTILNGSVKGKSVYASLDPLPNATTVEKWRTSFVAPNTTGWFFFLDDTTGANWEHPCRYVFVDANDTTTVVEAFSPPTNINISHYAGESPYPGGDANSVRSVSPNPGGGLGTLNLQLACSAPDCSHNYALLISGGFNTTQNHIRYWNDISFMYQTLNQTYGYPADHITVLMSDGTSTAPDRHNATAANGDILTDNSPVNLDTLYGPTDVTGDAHKTTVVTTLSTLNGKLTAADSLFIFTTSHGGWDGVKNSNNSILYLWNQDYITDTEFIASLPANPGNITMTMEQCYSGGFVDDFIDKYAGTQRRVIATAANGSEPSWGNSFSNTWTSGVARIDDARLPNFKADINRDNKISMWEAYNYSLNYDPAAADSLPNHEHPQYSAKNPLSAGTNQYFSSCTKVLVADFYANVTSGIAPMTVKFTDTSTGSPATWNWTFGDGNVTGATVQNPVHTYRIAGNYMVSLNVTNAKGFNSTRKTGYITVSNPAVLPDKIGVFRPSTHTFYLKNETPTPVISWGAGTDLAVTGDWNGDHRTDVGVFRNATHIFYLKNGTTTVISWGAGTDLPVTGDWNGDGRTEVGVYRPSTHTFYLKNGTRTTAINWGAGTDLPVTGDWNGDGKTEVGVYRPSTYTFYLKNGTRTTAISWGAGTDLPVTGDWNGDGRTEVGVYRPSTHTFYLKIGTTTTVINWGAGTDLPVTGDWNGDRRTEVGVYRPSTHSFYLKNETTTTTTAISWGISTDLPVTGDWNGDRRTDVGVFRPSTHTFYLKNGTTTTTVGWGLNTDKPVTGDWNGDGLWDVGVFRPSSHTFYLKNGTKTTTVNWGLSTDTPVTGDWNGDRRTEVGVFRNSTHTFYLKNGTTTTAISWGVSTDLPVTGDWNGDGRTDVGVFRNSTHMFYLKTGTTTTAISWGASTDKPVTGKW
jgi:PKD repeat protein